MERIARSHVKRSMRAFAVALVVTLATSAAAQPTKGHPWIEEFRAGLGSELQGADLAALNAIDLSRTAGKRDAVVAYTLADIVARDLAPRGLVLANLPMLARRLETHAPVGDAASARAIEKTLRATANSARVMSPTRCKHRGRCPLSPGENAAHILEQAAESLADLAEDPHASVQLAIDMYVTISGSMLTMSEAAALRTSRKGLLDRAGVVYGELVALVDAQGGGKGKHELLVDLRQQLLDEVGEGEANRFSAKLRVLGTTNVPVVLRLADYTVRELAPRTLDDLGRAKDAAALRKLAPLRDAATVQAARTVVKTLSQTSASVLDAVLQAENALDASDAALAAPTDLEAGSAITGITALSLSLAIDTSQERLVREAEVTAAKTSAALAIALVKRLAR
jgi:hypothetical protein